MTPLDLDYLGDLLSAEMTQVLSSVHLEGAEEADLRVPAIHDNSITLSLKAKHTQIPHVL